MSDATAPNKTEAPKAEPAKSEASSSSAGGSESTASTSGSGAKSASQTSISHFSSVSTPAYRSGWENIFGSKKQTEDAKPEPESTAGIPGKLTLEDADINPELRRLLDAALVRLAQKNGFDLSGNAKAGAFKYSIDCQIS